MFKTHRKKAIKFIVDLKDFSEWRETLYFVPVCLLKTCKAVKFERVPEQQNLVPLRNVDAKFLSRAASYQVKQRMEMVTHLVQIGSILRMQSLLDFRAENLPVLFLSIFLTFTIVIDMYVIVLVTQSCLALCNPMDCSPPGSSGPWNSRGKNTGVDSHSLLQGIFLTQ